MILREEPNGELESYKTPKGKISSNFTGEVMAPKGAFNNYHRKTVESFGSILRFSGFRSGLQAILRTNSQLILDIIVLIKKISCSPNNMHFLMDTSSRRHIRQWAG
ncbi:hypothetical protein TNCV_3929211 [Trichonephila clavipes]|nr:hypothetical protein TNCV_3929211 [Trichonephila clavipes]